MFYLLNLKLHQQLNFENEFLLNYLQDMGQDHDSKWARRGKKAIVSTFKTIWLFNYFRFLTGITITISKVK